ncbi:toxin biosynthesis protein-like protein [Westerdykella ornata]|uniref:Toxin biosynthesis protein-like protein n=1 Tax=Westerdykella ornata TaxID=318751 RepID=A0A6A6JKK5_WESOR|nr:toxin biosynthesis protein-like protein [Westerdykella ornata]KAF2276226.1 toxin biosynthesis protein-like protein [Westerdykella ornata]
MSSDLFRVYEHIVDASHIRGFPRTTSTTQNEVLQLSVKQYTPHENPNPKPGDITVIAAHANGFPKELYEPLWDELLKTSKQQGFSIRGIWIADVVHQGRSGVLNEHKLGNDPAWLDHSRDLLHVVNTFRKQMPRPIFGVGHSMGGAQLAHLAILHPRLFESLILFDPVIQRMVSVSGNISPALSSAMRRDRWPSREDAAKSMMRNPFYQAWNPRVFERWIQYGLRDLPTALYPDSAASPGPVPAAISAEPTLAPAASKSKEVTLTTTKHQEVMTFLRPNFPYREGDKEPSSAEYTASNPSINRRTHPDLSAGPLPQAPFYRGESMMVFQQLPHLRPSVLYVFGSKSFLTMHTENITEKMENTGVGVGGSGGAKEGRVSQVMVQDAGHLIPMEKVEESASHAAMWIGKEMQRWRINEKLTEEEWGNRKGVERSVLTERFLEELKETGKKGLPAVKKERDAKL